MNKIFRIVQYIQPWEIDNFERQVNQMIQSSFYISNDIKIIWDVTLNTSIIDWDKSQLPEEYLLNKFKYLETITNYYYTAEFDLSAGIQAGIQGAADKKRSSVLKNQDYVIWLDSDIYFSKYTLPYLTQSAIYIEEPLFILTPEIIKYWDDSWDCITHYKFLNEPHNHRDYFDLYSLDILVENNEFSLKKINQLKFGSGWFTLLPNQLIQQIEIPEEIGSYGPEDTYLMCCAKILGINQYVLKGIVVSEIGEKYLTNQNYIKPLLHVKISDKQKISDIEFNQLVNKFYNRYNS